MEGELRMGKEGKTGVNKNTPQNVLFGAGTIHKNLKYENNAWNYADTCVGATNGGSSLNITPELYNVPVDGANVAIKQLVQKVGETATLEINFAELKKELIIASTIAEESEESEDTTMTVIQPKPELLEDDFWENIAFVGKTLDNRPIIAILDNPLCTSGLPVSGTTRESATITATFTCHADIDDDDDLEVLPWRIYYPKTKEEIKSLANE
jgi:hypothetical protein